jgi:GNAT superfamily N-acetyltransferase
MATARIAASDDEIRRCFPVMSQLRTHLVEAEFVARVRLQEREGWRLAYVEDGGRVRSVAGFRYLENLAAGRVLYVDDLVTDSGERSKGNGQALIDWLIDVGDAAFARDALALRPHRGVGIHREYLVEQMRERECDRAGPATEIEEPAGPVESEFLL